MKSIKLLVILNLLFTAVGCQKSEERGSSGTENFLRISFQSEVRSLDPRVGIDYPSAFAVKMLFEGLMRIGPNGVLQHAIASAHTVSEDHKTYTFTLRPAHWSNGDKLTSHDFLYAWTHVVDPNYGTSLGVQNYYPIKNVQDIVKGKKPLSDLGVRVIDDYTLEVELEHPTPYFLEVLATSAFFPVNPRVDKEDPNWANKDGEAFVCNGPYVLKKHRIEDHITVVKNPTYWDEQNVTMPGIQIAIIKDSTTQLSLFEKNRLEWLGKPLSKMPLDAIDHLREKGKVEFFETLGLYWYFINTESFPFNNKKMRQAFAYAINRKAITDYITQGEETPAMSVLPHALATQEEPFFADNNREKALALFEEALIDLGLTREELPAITINYASASIHLLVAEALQEQWNEVFGLSIKLENQDWKAHYGKLQKGNFQIGGMAWQSWLRDPIYIMQTFRGKSAGINMSRWENKEYQDLLDLAELEIDPAKRKECFRKAEALLMEEMPVIPVYFTTIAYAKREDLKNVYVSDLYEVDFRWSYFEKQ